jgi:hypothetical protein
MSDPKPATLDFSDVTNKPRIRPDSSTQARALLDSRDAGFTERSETVKIDRRTTRPRQSVAKVQINLKVPREVRTSFVDAARDAGDRDAAVLNLGSFFERVWAFYLANHENPRA